jgi:phosphatidate cytidylyltransferase
MPNWCSRMSSGPISRRSISPPRWRSSPGGSDGSGLVLAEAASRWSDLSRRVLSAIVVLPVALGCIWAGGYPFLALIAAGCVICTGEWVTMCGYAPRDPPMLWMSIILVAAALCGGMGAAQAGLLLLLGGTMAAVIWRGSFSTAAQTSSARLDLAFGVPYLGLTAVVLPWLRADPLVGWPNTLFMLAIVWASDIGAYAVGRLLGGPKLAPSISPGKTWSGSLGGLVSAALAGIAVAACFSSGFSPSHVVELAIGIGIVSQAGDLLESVLKRRFGVKDSGSILPGHGGLLDRLDALLAVAPTVALLAFFVGRGVVLWR